MRVLRNRNGVLERRMRQELRFVSEYVFREPDVRQRNVRRRLDAVLARVFREPDVRVWCLHRRDADVLAVGVQYLRRRRVAVLRASLRRDANTLLHRHFWQLVLRSEVFFGRLLQFDHSHYRNVDVRRET